MTRDEIFANSNLLTFAGSESSANTTASLLYRVAADAKLRGRILHELHTNFASDDAISSTKAMALPYLRAVIEESMRLHPVTPNALWRETPKQGNWILGEWIPGGVCLSYYSNR
jgi:cytochrome P450